MTDQRTTRTGAALTVLCIGFFLIMLDTTIVVVAVPTIQARLGASLNETVWVTSAYLLTYAVPLLLSGRLGDWVGRRPMFLAGMAVFTLASLWCALASSAPELIAARAVAGLGAAAMTPQTMAFLTALYPPERRGTPIGIWAGVGAVAAAVGPVLGGVLVGVAGWPWIFVVNVPIGIAGLLLGLRVLPVEAPRRSGRPDLLGALLSGLGLLAVVFALQNAADAGWAPVAAGITMPELFAGGIVLLGGFVLWQARMKGAPLMPLGLFRHRDFSVAALVVAAVSFGLAGLSLPVVLFLQSGLGLSPATSGLLTMPQAVAAAVVGPLSGRLADRIHPRTVVILGAVTFAAGALVLAVAGGPGTVVAGSVLCGVGSGAVYSPLVVLATRGLPGELVGSASGVYNLTRQVGMLLGSAGVGVLLQLYTATGVGLGDAARTSLLLPSGVLVVAVLLAVALRRERGQRAGSVQAHPTAARSSA